MSKNLRIVIPGVAHHVTQRGNNRQAVFEDRVDYLNYCQWMNQYAGRNCLGILAYCLMPNHVHFIVIPEKEESLSKTFHAVHMRYAQYMNRKKEASGHLWQGRFYSCPLHDRHLYRALRYVEQNPVRGQIVDKAWQYLWSSARWHLGLMKTPDIYLQESEIIERKRWKDYLCEEDVDFKVIHRDQVLEHQVPVNNYSKRMSSR
ncbi:MAG TPA: transposase [Candidatus Omnitrophota bacterium]|nr:transposase [Candidatus Omnitrophota bacterium]